MMRNFEGRATTRDASARSNQPVEQSSVHTGVPELRAKVQPRRAVALPATTRP